MCKHPSIALVKVTAELQLVDSSDSHLKDRPIFSHRWFGASLALDSAS